MTKLNWEGRDLLRRIEQSFATEYRKLTEIDLKNASILERVKAAVFEADEFIFTGNRHSLEIAMRAVGVGESLISVLEFAEQNLEAPCSDVARSILKRAHQMFLEMKITAEGDGPISEDHAREFAKSAELLVQFVVPKVVN